MSRTVKVLLSVITLCLISSGCASSGPRAAYTSGQIGCSPSEIVITDGDMGWTTNTWTATCRDKTFYCTYSTSYNYASRTTCTEAVPPS